MQAAEIPARIGVSRSAGVVVMGSFSLMHWIVVLAIILILFGAGKLPRVMGDFAKGIKAFKSGMKEEDEPTAAGPTVQVVPPPSATAATPAPVATVADRPREPACRCGRRAGAAGGLPTRSSRIRPARDGTALAA